jgi:hypothetical protein
MCRELDTGDLTRNDGQFVNRSLIGYGGGASGNFLLRWFG